MVPDTIGTLTGVSTVSLELSFLTKTLVTPFDRGIRPFHEHAKIDVESQ